MASIAHHRNGRADRSCLLAAMVLLLLLSQVVFRQGPHFTLFELQDQDWPVVAGAGLLLVLLHLWRPSGHLPALRLDRRAVAAALLLTAALLGGLTHLLMGDFAISRDEHMVLFDMAVFESGRIAMPIAPEWRGFAKDLVPAFLLNEEAPRALVSAYLPMNALIRTGFDQLGIAQLMNPLLYAAGGIALFDIARRQFGQDRRAILVALLVYMLSMQAWAAAMTPYAMTGHLALNLIWLAAFLRGGRWHLVAIAAGAVATGLHQLAFHPLFAAPFLAQRLWRGEWRLALGYAAAYAVICAGWIAWPLFVSTYTGTAVADGASHGNFLSDRLLPLLLHRDPATAPLMIMNLLRFFAWQHLAVVPLLLAALPLAGRKEGIALPLFAGTAAALLLFAIVLPYQGHGWGYRYLHGFIGSVALLAALGYRELRQGEGRFADGLVVVTTAATLVAMVWLGTRIHAFVAPHVALERHIAAIDADLLIIDTEEPAASSDGRWVANAIDFARNRPDLANRPIRLSSRFMSAAKAARLCQRGTIALLTRADQQRAGFGLNQPVRSPGFEKIIARLRADTAAGRCRLVG